MFTARLIWWPPSADDAALSYDPLQQALASTYFLLGVTILVWHAHMAWSQRDPSRGHRQFVAGLRNSLVSTVSSPAGPGTTRTPPTSPSRSS